MQKWEYMWMYVNNEGGEQVYIANGARLSAQTYPQALNVLGNEGWELVAVLPRETGFSSPKQSFPQFCLKRPVSG